jgi:hypothetical protein
MGSASGACSAPRALSLRRTAIRRHRSALTRPPSLSNCRHCSASRSHLRAFRPQNSDRRRQGSEQNTRGRPGRTASGGRTKPPHAGHPTKGGRAAFISTELLAMLNLIFRVNARVTERRSLSTTKETFRPDPLLLAIRLSSKRVAAGSKGPAISLGISNTRPIGSCVRMPRETLVVKRISAAPNDLRGKAPKVGGSAVLAYGISMHHR